MALLTNLYTIPHNNHNSLINHFGAAFLFNNLLKVIIAELKPDKLSKATHAEQLGQPHHDVLAPSRHPVEKTGFLSPHTHAYNSSQNKT